MNDIGLVHLYCGDGKGKTTAAMGLALRCVGHRKAVVIAQFLKDGLSGECRAFAKLDKVTMLAANPYGKFSHALNEEERTHTAEAVSRTFRAATEFAGRTKARMLVLDEVCAAIIGGFLDEDEVLRFLAEKPAELEVVLTGRDPSKRLQDAADYISEMKKHRHPFDKGITAREDIEV